MSAWATRAVVGVVAMLIVVAGTGNAAGADPLPDARTTTTTTIVDVEGPVADNSSPGLFDVSGKVQKAIDDWFASLVTSAITPTLALLGRVLLQAPDLTEQPDVHGVWLVTLNVPTPCSFVLRRRVASWYFENAMIAVSFERSLLGLCWL